MSILLYIWANNALTQICANSTNCINAACIFCLIRGLAHSWRNGEAQCCQLNNFADPFSNFFPFKKASKPNLVSETLRYCCMSARSCFPSAREHNSLSLCASALFSERRRGAALSVKHRYYVASLILHASIAEITAQLGVFDLHQTTAWLSGFLCRLTSWKGKL